MVNLLRDIKNFQIFLGGGCPNPLTLDLRIFSHTPIITVSTRHGWVKALWTAPCTLVFDVGRISAIFTV